MIAELRADLAELLFNLGGWTVYIRPVESHTSRTVLQSVRAVQGRQIRRQTLLDGRALPRFHPLPRLTLPAVVEVRVAALHLCDCLLYTSDAADERSSVD